MDAIQAIHLDSPADKTVRSVICTFSGWIQHTEMSPQRVNSVDFYLSVGGHVVPLRRTLYSRSDLDSRYGTGFTLYVDLQLMASAARIAWGVQAVELRASLDQVAFASKPISLDPSMLSAASMSIRNALDKRRRLPSLLFPHFSHVDTFPVNALAGSCNGFNPSIESKNDPVSSFAYDGSVLDFVSSFDENEILLDIGCGLRSSHLPNIINCEIYDYPSTDILCSCDALSFKDNSVDGVLSLAVLEHVSNPFTCAREIMRVLKPGGKLFLKLPFMQAEHGYPYHFFYCHETGSERTFLRCKTRTTMAGSS